MTSSIILAALITILIVALGILFIYKRKDPEYKHEPDYRVFFILGITWLPLGIATDNPAFWGMGAVFMIAGLANRDKWKEQPKFSEMDPAKRKLKLSIIIGLTVLLVAGILVFLLAK
ncbi:MAG: hypothetical protein HN855_08585 [Anaerolineae bacterium]|jgi:hypothetical protein|nr:hypothetical protein [Anaerolineae bacterium]MBT7071674.1 hypothetical protein [Anaerolineae bacterium]MBT7325200.1 hypothetical protein [Anaerolineae bacterium]